MREWRGTRWATERVDMEVNVKGRITGGGRAEETGIYHARPPIKKAGNVHEHRSRQKFYSLVAWFPPPVAWQVVHAIKEWAGSVQRASLSKVKLSALALSACYTFLEQVLNLQISRPSCRSLWCILERWSVSLKHLRLVLNTSFPAVSKGVSGFTT